MKGLLDLRHRLVLSLLLALLLTVPLGAGAQVKPGDFITPENASKVKSLLPPGVFYNVTHGMTMKIIPTGRIDWPPPYKEATEKYAPQVRLSKDRRSLMGYVAGQPFPMIDANDPDVAIKIMWNNNFRPELGDDYDLRFFDCKSVYVGNPQVINYYLVGHYAGYNLVGRTEVEPTPTDPDFKQTGRLWLNAVYPYLAPQSARGAGAIRYRYADPNRPDDTWSWNPGSRRVRRLNEAILSSVTGPSTIAYDNAAGFNAKTEEFTYRFLGEKNLLGCFHAEHSPLIECKTDGGATACPEAWEVRHLYIVEALPRRDLIGEHLNGKHIIYMDSEEWWPPYVESYDRAGQLWYVNVWWNTYRDRPSPNSRVAIYPFKRAFSLAHGATDVQHGFATNCYLPPVEAWEAESWYINMGAVDRDFFTLEAMKRAAPGS